MTLPRFYPVLDSADWVARATRAGARLIQLRIKDRSPGDLREEIATAQVTARATGAALVVNDHWQLAIELGCDWLHLGQEDLDTADLPAIRRAGLRLGVSTHDHAELDRALDLSPDYVALGPIHPTRLKKMKWHRQGVEKLTEWRALIGPLPLVAIGGMTVENAADAFAAGADSVAAVTDITLDPAPDARLAAWVEATR